MNRTQKTIMSFIGVAFVLSGAVVIFSQQPPPAAGTMVYQYERGPQEPGTAPRTPLPRDDTFNFISGEMSFDGKLVKGAPYSGQAVTETTQTLSDGNRIVNKTTASLYRDSEGRTRREQSLRTIGAFATANDSPHMIFINDPVAQMNYVLDPRTRIARKMPSFRFEVKVTAPPDNAKTTAPNQTSTTNPNNSGNDYVTTTVPIGDGGYRVESFGGGRRTQTQSLGKQLVEGVEAEGMRTTVTIPAGEIGNDRPIEIVNERWYSAELQMVIMTRQSDPRSGEAVYRLTNIDRGEPDKSLFEIPGDYTVKPSGLFEESGGSVNTTTASTPGAINGGVLNGKTTSMPAPAYPPIARQARASGPVTVQVLVDEGGNVIEAKAIAGHPLLQAAAVAAARQAKLAPTRLSGQPVRVTGTLIYNFVAQP